MASGAIKTDEELVREIVSGRREMYGQIVARYEKKLGRYVMALINRKDEVDDILQTVFLKAYMNLPAFDRRLKFSSWLYRIAHNESINLMGSGFIRTFTSFPDWFLPRSGQDVEEEVHDRQMKETLKKCVDRLDVKYREPLVLFYYEEKSYGEISDILRIPVRNVGVLIHRGKLKLKEFCHEKNNR